MFIVNSMKSYEILANALGILRHFYGKAMKSIENTRFCKTNLQKTLFFWPLRGIFALKSYVFNKKKTPPLPPKIVPETRRVKLPQDLNTFFEKSEILRNSDEI